MSNDIVTHIAGTSNGQKTTQKAGMVAIFAGYHQPS
jgi:hypothetical protein